MKLSKIFITLIRVSVVVGLVFVMLSLDGCRTVKQTLTTKNEVKTSANLDVKQSVDNKLTVDSSKSVVDKSVTSSLVNEDITVTHLSKPDSTGKQYPIQMTVIHRTTDNNKSADVKTDTKVNIKKQNKTTLSDKSEYKSDDKSKLVTTKETTWAAWTYPIGLAVFLALIAGCYYLIKKYNVIGWIIGLWNKIN